VLRAIANGLGGAVVDVDGDNNIDIAEVVLEIVTIDYAQVIMAASGDIPNAWMKKLRDAGHYVLLVEGTIQTASNGLYCRIFDMPDAAQGPDRIERGIWDPYVNYYNDADLGLRADFTMAGATLWLAKNADAVVALGTCAAYGGIPAARGSVTGGVGAWEWINQINGMNKTIANVPGCPPHPDWFIQTVGAYLVGALHLDLTPDHRGRPRLTSTAIFNSTPFCNACPRNGTGTPPTKLIDCAPSVAYPNGRCMVAVGCNGSRVSAENIRADCPSRKWNHIESYPGGALTLTKNNWCVGNSYPCQGCTDPGFPDLTSPFFSSVHGYY
jgi:hydrogenase small subunit